MRRRSDWLSDAASAGLPTRPRKHLRRLWMLAVLAALAVAIGSLLAALPPASADITYQYDNAGRLKVVNDGAGNVINYGYDNDGNITSVTKTQQQAPRGAAPASPPAAPPPVRFPIRVGGTSAK
jgi:YD repeat-containing protein